MWQKSKGDSQRNSAQLIANDLACRGCNILKALERHSITLFELLHFGIKCYAFHNFDLAHFYIRIIVDILPPL